jgi:hypothetical protein
VKESNAPQGQDNTPNHTNDSQNSGTLGNAPPRVGGDPPSPPEHRNPNGNSDQPPWWDRPLRIGTFIGEIVLIVITLRIACIYSGQLEAMRDGNSISRDNLVKVQSAFVIVNPVPEMQTTTSDTGQQDAWFHFPMDNTGTTTAINIKAHINTLTGPGLLPENFAFPDAPDTGGTRDDGIPIIGPKATAPLTGHVTREKLERFYKHEIRLYFYGWVTYNDIFDKTKLHVSKFSYELVSVGTARLANGQEGKGLQTIFTGLRHNCYNEQCKEKERQ